MLRAGDAMTMRPRVGEALPAAGPMTLLLDYDGTLVPYAPTPEEAVPDPDLQRLLARLAGQPGIHLHIVSGRSVETIERWFAHLGATLWAEHGAARRPAHAREWETLVPAGREWMDKAARFLESMAADTPGALVEIKSTGVAWHYRRTDPALAADRLATLRERVGGVIGDAPVELLEGRMVLELRPRGISKAAVVHRILEEAPPEPVVAIGDDRTDEEMFAALPAGGVAIRVGDGESRAPYRLADYRAVRQLLAELVDARRPDPAR
jgi:trehalose 6-phosphate synthase/phosphatase